MNDLKFGWSEVRLVPKGAKVDLIGQFYERITSEEKEPLTVTALAIECGADQAIFCSCDLVGTSYYLLNSVRDILKKNGEIPFDKVMVNATHVHTGPGYARCSDMPASLDVLKRFKPEDIEYKTLVSNDSTDLFAGEEAHAYIAERIAEAATAAWRNRASGKFSQGFGRATVGMCRRVCYDDGSAKMWGDTNMANFTELEGGSDSGIELLFIADENEKLTGVVASLACPAQTLEHRSFMSADFWGGVKKLLREKYGDDIYLLALCSISGDQCPRDLVRWVDPETPINDPNIVRDNVTVRVADPSMFDVKGCDLISRRIANEIFWAFDEKTKYVSDVPFEHKVINLDIPLRRVTIEENDKAFTALESFFKNVRGEIDFKDTARMHVHAGTVARYELQQKSEAIEIEIHIIRLGNIAFATNPFEPFINYGNRIKARSKASQTFLVQLCCGTYEYIPTEKAEKGSHYSAYVSSGITDHIGGEILERKTISEINKMFDKA